MLCFRNTTLCLLLLCASVGRSCFAQDNELQKVMLDASPTVKHKLSLENLRGEQTALTKIIDNLSRFRDEQFAAHNAKKRELNAQNSGEAPEILQALLRNSRMELQKLTWDEAAEAAMLEAIESEKADPEISQPALVQAELRQREKTLRADLKTLQEQLEATSSEKSTPRERLDLVAKIQVAQNELNSASGQLYKQEEIIRTAALTATLDCKRRLAQIRVRRKLLEREIAELNGKIAELQSLAADQWLLEMERKDLESLHSRIAPLQFRKLEVDALISAVEGK